MEALGWGLTRARARVWRDRKDDTDGWWCRERSAVEESRPPLGSGRPPGAAVEECQDTANGSTFAASVRELP